jgi:3'(2'), 5'-bisphosphate nucleotidase
MNWVKGSTTAQGDSALAAHLAAGAGQLLAGLREAAQRGDTPPKQLGILGDGQSQAFLAAQLRRHRPGDSVLSEEAANDPSRCAAPRVWIIDPLDGTREFSEGRLDWAVHVALWEGGPDAGRLTAGAVALPAENILLSTGTEPRLPPRRSGPVRLAVSRTRPPSFATALAEEFGWDLVPLGSAGYKAAAVIRGEADAYLHSGGQYEWDSAAPVAVAAARGLHVSRLDGTPLRYNQADPYLPDLLICRPGLSRTLLASAKKIGQEAGRPL